MTIPGGGGTAGEPPRWAAPGAPPAPGQVPPAPVAPPVPPAPGPTGYGGPAAGPPHWTMALTAHRPGIIPLRPLGFGDILEGSFAAMRRNPRTFFGLSFLVTLGVVLGIAALGAIGYLAATSFDLTGTSDQVIGVVAVGGLSVVYLLTAITGVVLTGMLAYPVGEAVLGRKPGIGETWSRTRRMLLRLAGLCLVLLVPVLVVFGGLLALVVVSFSSGSDALGSVGLLGALAALVAVAWAGIRLALATPALVLEDLGVIAALRRSWGLTRGRFWRTLGLLIVSTLILAVVQQVLGVAFQLLGIALGALLTSTAGADADGVVFVVVVLGSSVIGSLLSALLTQPFSSAVIALIYTDARIRAEGFDLALVRAVTGAPVAP